MRSLGEATARADGPDSPWRNPSGSVDEIGRSASCPHSHRASALGEANQKGLKGLGKSRSWVRKRGGRPDVGATPKAARWVTICQNEQRLGLLGLNLGEHGRNRGPMYRTSTYVSEEHMLTRQFCYI